MLSIRDVSISYGAIEAVRGIEFEVTGGEVFALLGPNGAGKTSTLRAITALTPYSGSITFEGDEVSRVGTEGLARRGLIHVPEGRQSGPPFRCTRTSRSVRRHEAAATAGTASTTSTTCSRR